MSGAQSSIGKITTERRWWVDRTPVGAVVIRTDTGQNYSPIFLPVEKLYEWKDLGEVGTTYGGRMFLSACFMVLVFVGLVVLIPWGLPGISLWLPITGAALVCAVIYFVTIRWMWSNTKAAYAWRRQRKRDFLKEFGGMHPNRVDTADFLCTAASNKEFGPRYILLPEGVNNHEEYAKLRK